jgi:hypothetical protein
MEVDLHNAFYPLQRYVETSLHCKFNWWQTGGNATQLIINEKGYFKIQIILLSSVKVLNTNYSVN